MSRSDRIWTRAFGPARRVPREEVLDDYLHFREELRAALREGTPAALRATLQRWAGSRGELAGFVRQPDSALEVAIRHLILEEPTLKELHPAARAWLWDREDANRPHRAA
jgi:hypothetical protein